MEREGIVQSEGRETNETKESKDLFVGFLGFFEIFGFLSSPRHHLIHFLVMLFHRQFIDDLAPEAHADESRRQIDRPLETDPPVIGTAASAESLSNLRECATWNECMRDHLGIDQGRPFRRFGDFRVRILCQIMY